jgi:phage-related protein (TIGR01555 family)
VLNRYFRRKQTKEVQVKAVEKPPSNGFFSTDASAKSKDIFRRDPISCSIQRTADEFIYNPSNFAQDDTSSLKAQSNSNQVINPLILDWYARQGFIGYQAAAVIAQNWLVIKACGMPARDAVRNGYEVTVNDGDDVSVEIQEALRSYDDEYKVRDNLTELIGMGRIFGIRIAKFVVESSDPDYYRKPFNIDGVAANSYKGISQIDPYWVLPRLDVEASSNPSAKDFYEPTFWTIGGELIHKSHLVIFKTDEVADILKPTYFYGGIPITQKIYEKVYNADRSSNEIPLLLMTKRLDILKMDIGQAEANNIIVSEKMAEFVSNRNNFGIKTIGLDEDMTQIDTSLTDVDTVTMTAYQLVAAAANVPATKLLGTTPKGFNATGEYEEASYHEELKTIQENDLTPFLNRHYTLVIKSEISPKFGVQPFEFKISWHPLDEMTAEELAAVNKAKAETGLTLMQTGAISADEERARIIKDDKSNYSGIDDDDSTPSELTDPDAALNYEDEENKKLTNNEDCNG